jgi:hypothetical protein
MSSHAECIPRGAYAPRSCFAMRTSADEKTIFAIHIRTSGQERRALARRGSEIVPARTIPRTSPHDRHTQHQERRASARRGNETHLQDGSLCVQRTTPPAAAGVSPPWFENRTCEDNSAHIPTRPSHAAPRAAGVSPPWKRNRSLQDGNRFEFRRNASSAAASSARRRSPSRESHACGGNSAHLFPHTTGTHSTKSGVRQPAVGL